MESYLFPLCVVLSGIVLVNCLCNFNGLAECVKNVDAGCEFDENSTSFNHISVDADNEGEVHFGLLAPVLSCGIDRYEIFVYVLTNVEGEAACKFEDYDSYYGIMIKKFIIHTEEYSPCSQLNLKFCTMYLFRGCYHVAITPYNGANSLRPVSHYLWLESKHTVDDFKISPPSFVYLNRESGVEARWSFDKNTILRQGTKFKVIIDSNGQADLCNFITLEMTNNCTMVDKTIICQTGNIPQGKYFLTLTLRDKWRCMAHEGIYNSCDWPNAEIERFISPNASMHVLNSENVSLTEYKGLMVALVIFLIISMSGVGWCILKRRDVQMSFIKSDECKLTSKLGYNIMTENTRLNGIFLVYARDCEPFMASMIAFRTVLSELTHCKVYDIYDDDLFNEIAMSPHEFVESLIHKHNMKVVLVATECADKLYQGIIRYYSNTPGDYDKEGSQLMLSYCTPSWLDGLLIHTLKLISFDISPTPYHKFFVVRLPRFSGKIDYLSHVNPFKRFDIPDGLDTLIENMTLHSHKDETGEDKNKKCVSVGKEALSRELMNLQNFVKVNPQYLMTDILNDEYYMNI